MSPVRKTRVKEVAEIREITQDVADLVNIASQVKDKVKQVRLNLLTKITKSSGTYPIDQILGDIQELNEQYRKLFGKDAISNTEIFETVCDAL